MANGLLNIVVFPLALYSDLRIFEASMRGIDLDPSISDDAPNLADFGASQPLED